MAVSELYMGVYCTRFPYALYRHMDLTYKSELDPGSYHDEGTFTKSMVVDRAREVLGLVQESVDHLLVLINQDDLNAINDIINHIEVHKKAVKFKAVPSVLARISYIINQFPDESRLLPNNSHVCVVECHHGGYDVHVILKSENNYQVLESTAYKTLIECGRGFHGKKEKYAVNFSMVGTDESSLGNVYASFGCHNICRIPELHKVLMEGGFSKIVASIQGYGEVLDFPPRISVQIFDRQGSFFDLLLGPGKLELVHEYVRRNILGFSVAYDDDLCVMKFGDYSRQSKTIVPFQQCAGVRIAATTGRFGTIHLNMNALSETCLEAWIPSEEEVEQMGSDIAKQLKMLSIDSENPKDFWKHRQSAEVPQTEAALETEFSHRVSVSQPRLHQTVSIQSEPSIHEETNQSSDVKSCTSPSKYTSSVEPSKHVELIPDTVTTNKAQNVDDSLQNYLEFTVADKYIFVKKYSNGQPDNPGKSHDASVAMFVSRCGPNFIFGKTSREMKINHNVDYVLYDISKLIGRPFNQVKIDPTWPFEVVPFGSDRKAAYLVNVDKTGNTTVVTPVSALSYLFCHLKNEMNEESDRTEARLILDENEFNEDQVTDILMAAGLAKLNVFEVEIA